MKKTLKSLLAGALAVLLLIAAVPMNISFAALVPTFTSGIYTYSVENGNAMIEKVERDAKGEIIIPDKLGGYPVTDIGWWALNGCADVEKVVLPDSVQTISDEVFSGCVKLKEVVFGAGVRSIMPYTFSDTPALERISVSEKNKEYASVNGLLFNKEKTKLVLFPVASSATECVLPDTVTDITYITDSAYYNNAENWEDGALYIGNNLIKVKNDFSGTFKIKKGTKVIAQGAFENCPAITSVIVPAGVTHINSNAFLYCPALKSIVLPDSITDIDDGAFCCTAIKSMKIPAGLTEIAEEMFSGCKSLESVTIPDSVKKIGSGAFSGCTSLKSITIPDSVKIIEYNAFARCTSLKSITIPDSVTELGYNAFEDCSALKTVNLPDTLSVINSRTFSGCTALESIKLPSGLSRIGAYAFNGCSALKSITVPANVETIDSCAFLECEKLKTIKLPDGITDIGSEAFEATAYYNTSSNWESDVLYIGNYLIVAKERFGIDDYIKEGTKLIADEAFGNVTGLSAITIPDSVEIIGYRAFAACHSLEDVSLGKGIKHIGSYAFFACGQLSEVVIPDSVETIGESAFERTKYYSNSKNWKNKVLYMNGHLVKADTSISGKYTIESGTKSISARAFENCEKLSSIIIPDSVKSIGAYAFYSCSALKSAAIPDGVTSIPQAAFSNCTSLKEITIPDSVTSIEDQAFYSCIALKSVTIPDGVTSIGYEAFRNCTALKEITIPDSVTSIGKLAFYNCSSLKKITIPASVTSIGHSAFRYCNNLTDVYFPACESVWNKIDIEDYNNSLTRATIHFAEENHGSYTTKTTKKASCTENGNIQHSYPCGCIKNVEIPATGHTWGEWKVTKPATASNEGTEERACTACKTKETRSIAKLPSVVESIKTNEKIKTSTIAKDSVFALAGQSVADLKKSVAADVQVLDKNSKAVADKAKLATGMQIVLTDEKGNVLDTVTVVVPGDVNGDGEVKAADARSALRAAVKLDTLTDCEKTAADLDTTSSAHSVNSADARHILRMSVKLEDANDWIKDLK